MRPPFTFSLRRAVGLLVLVLLSWLAGAYQETRTDDTGWCAHFTRFMVCSASSVTDYVFADGGR